MAPRALLDCACPDVMWPRTVTRSASVRSAHTSATGDTSITSGLFMQATENS